MKSKPYPKPRVQEINFQYAKLLLNVYAGEISEESAIHLYLYEAFALDDKYEDYKKMLLEIAKTEMIHLCLLGNTIKALGFLPKFTGCKGNIATFWNAGYIPYTNQLQAMWQVNLESEQKAIDEYRCLLKKIHDPYIQETLKRILEDEEKHAKIFAHLLH